LVTTSARRNVVQHLRAAFKMSERRTCRLVGLRRSTQRYRPRRRDAGALLGRLRELAAARPRFGYRRLHLLLRREGVSVNAKRVYRLYRAEGLAVRIRRRKKLRVPRLPPIDPPTKRNERWAMDFVSDVLTDGRRFRALTLIDALTRESPAIEVDTSLPGARVMRVLDRVAAERGGYPKSITVDNGPEFICTAMDKWAYEHGVELRFIQPGKPMQNGQVESFNGRFRDECLSQSWFPTLARARAEIELWRVDYNAVRPHSALDGRTPLEFVRDLDSGCSAHNKVSNQIKNSDCLAESVDQ
jgi:putative transposase